MFQSCASPRYSFSNVPEAPPVPMVIPLPHPILLVVLFGASLASWVAGKIAQAVPMLDKPDILGSTFLTLMCVSGSCLGAAIFVLTFARKDPRTDIVAKALVSAFTGFVVSPFLVRWRDWPEVPSVVLFVSACMAMIAWSVVIKGVPWLGSKVTGLMDKSTDNKP